tara:strand:- start:1145 stop:2521 length:1377 start_codon:yes stop_codon:yes gene_type:complete
MDKKEFEFILQKGEGLKIEFKENLSGLDKEIVAMANFEGGRIFLGVNDKGEAKGIKITNKLKSQVQDIANNCDPPIEIDLREFENILIIGVKEGKDRPYKCKEGFFMRIGPNSQKISRDQILGLAVDEGKIKFDSMVNNKFDFREDFDEDRLDDYLNKAGLSKSISDKLILKELGVMDEKLNNAGVLFFSKELQRFIPQSVFTCVLFRNKEGSEVIDRKEIIGSLIEIVEEVMKFVKFYVKVAYKFTGKPKRENIYEYPLEAIREAVINSVMHKDYFETGHNNILKIFPGKIQIENIWRKPKNFKLGETVFRRNPIIANLFAGIHFGERLGSGFARMRYYCEEESAPVPEIKFTDVHFYVLFKQNPEYLKLASEKTDKNIASEWLTQVNARLTQELSEQEREILIFIFQNEKINSLECQKLLHVSRVMANRYFNRLIKRKLIERKGAGKYVYYVLNEA